MVRHDSGGKVRRKLAADVVSRAVFGGKHHQYRYLLHRTWSATGGTIMFLMMNPSTADIDIDDPTVAKCQRYARRWGFGSLFIANTFAYRATDQKQLLAVADPVGPENDAYILQMAAASDRIVLAYGKPHRALQPRGVHVQAMLHQHGHTLAALRLCADGTPSHPLYLRDDLVPIPLEAPGVAGVGNASTSRKTSRERTPPAAPASRTSRAPAAPRKRASPRPAAP